MRIESFGCSFIFGTDLADDGRNTHRATPSQLTWPAHLARYLGKEYQCYARPGSGNLQILDRVLNRAAVDDCADLFVIGWTWLDRFDYYDPIYDPNINRNPWSTIMPIDKTELAHVYYRDLHSEYRDKFTSLSYIKLVVDTLSQKNIPFLMTYMDELLFDQRWYNTPAIMDLQNYVKPHLTTFEGQTFLNWSKSQGFEISPTLHPLESAHQAAGEYMIKVFDKQNIIGC